MPAFMAWFTKHYDLSWPKQDASPGAGGLGPLPKSGLELSVKKR
jgi:hypothetical protein